ncbi:MAG: TetR family transcriptional regulator C-terminal domain-containing protein [Holophagales bacterium]|nr:TetR family transcriptional regulator C-terminal domain-containing protein [Holophagales bacterium]
MIAAWSSLDRLAQALYRIAEAVDRDESIIPLTLEFWSVCGVEQTRERFGQRYAESLGDFRSRIVELLEHGQARGEVDPEAPLEAVASCLIAIVDGLFIQQWTVPETRVSATLKEALPIVLRSLRRQDTHA